MTGHLEYPESWRGLNVALVHDWLNGMRGGERCLELLCAGLPVAAIYTLLYQPEQVSSAISSHVVHGSSLQRIPGFTKHYRYFLPFFPAAIERFSLPPVDVVLSLSHCVAKGIRPPAGVPHICYCFTPMRYAWALQGDYFGRNRLKQALLDVPLSRLRKWDRAASDRVDRFVAISHYVKERIRRFYDRDAEVVYPPVATDYFTPDGVGGHDGFDLIVSALVPYKRVDLAVQAYAKTGYPLKVAGVGTEGERLQKDAPENITFLGRIPDEEIRRLYQRCRFLVFPGEEDFGIVPLEAQACGKPVLAFGKGGALETIVAGETGVFFEAQTPDALAGAMEEAAARSWDAAVIRQNAMRFTQQHFIDGVAKIVESVLKEGVRS